MHFVKKIKYFIDNKVATYIFKRYPSFIKFLHAFTDFLDNEVSADMMNFTNNLDTETMYDKFVQSYFEQLCKNSVDESHFIISRKIKKTLMNIAKMWYKTKGRIFSMDILLKYIGNYYVSSSGEYIGEISYDIVENEGYWLSNGIRPYDKPYTYTITGDVPIADLKFMLKSVNPLGYSSEFNLEFSFKDTIYNNKIFSEFFIHRDDRPSIIRNYVDYVETRDISSNSISESLTFEGKNQEFTVEEIFNVYPKYFRFDGRYKFDGHLDGNDTTSYYNAMDKGIYEDYEFVVNKNNVNIETSTLPIGRNLP